MCLDIELYDTTMVTTKICWLDSENMTIDTLYMQGKRQKVIAKEAGFSQSFISKYSMSYEGICIKHKPYDNYLWYFSAAPWPITDSLLIEPML